MSEVDYALGEVIDQCANVIEAHERRADGYAGLTLHEKQEVAVLEIRLAALREAMMHPTPAASSS